MPGSLPIGQVTCPRPPGETFLSPALVRKIMQVFSFGFQEAGGDIPVKEIMDLMQADPAFDVLFSLFGIGRFDSRGGTQCIPE